MLTVDEVIRRLGGNEAAAHLTGVGAEAVRKWRQSRAIPPKHWTTIMAASGITMDDLTPAAPSIPSEVPPGATAALVLSDGAVYWGAGFGAFTAGRVGELCFNTGMSGYQETLTDPSYAGQIITFTFPAHRQRRRQRRGFGGDQHRRPRARREG